jgi:hypothetical protein
MAKGNGQQNEVTIQSPGDGNPCISVSSGKIVAYGTATGNITAVLGMVLPEIVDAPNDPNAPGLPAPQRGFVSGCSGSGIHWCFEGRSGDDRRIAIAQGACGQNTLVVWGFFDGSSNVGPLDAKPFRANDTSGSCSGMAGSASTPIFQAAPFVYVTVPVDGLPNPAAGTLDEELAAGIPFVFDDDCFKFDAPQWNAKTPSGNHLSLVVSDNGHELVATIICQEKRAADQPQNRSKIDERARFCWMKHGWNFMGRNVLVYQAASNDPYHRRRDIVIVPKRP